MSRESFLKKADNGYIINCYTIEEKIHYFVGEENKDKIFKYRFCREESAKEYFEKRTTLDKEDKVEINEDTRVVYYRQSAKFDITLEKEEIYIWQ